MYIFNFTIVLSVTIFIFTAIQTSMFKIRCKDQSIKTMHSRLLQKTLDKQIVYSPIKIKDGCIYHQREIKDGIQANGTNFKQKLFLNYHGKVTSH